MSRIRFVVLDLGGVVVRICRSWEEACLRAGVAVREPARFEQAELARRRHQIVEEYQSGRIGCEAFWDAIAEASGGLYDAREVRLVHMAWTMEDYPGIERLLLDLRDVPQLTTACLSNTNHAHWELLRDGLVAPDAANAGAAALGPSRAVRALSRHMVSHELGASKPDDRIYALAEGRLGAAPQQIAFFDDLPENVEAASRRGWSAHLVDHTGDTASQVRAALRALQVI